ncbi:unnamed protein product [Mytilus edulis]|uniref:Tc1-like transposase DDE domain-containing protein n=1 Tax=Mytilus edulis TaxID=6550 RepID=A0A8S3RTL6_MYTED|nr:unnamed protein product [Mytilus edulis]
MVWGCVSYDCKLDLKTVRGNLKLNGQRHQQGILQASAVPNFDNHLLKTRPIFMDDYARPHRSRAVTAYLHDESVETLPWPACSPDLNPIEHIWDIIGRKVRKITPPVQNLAELDNALHHEWQQPIQQQTGENLNSPAVVQDSQEYYANANEGILKDKVTAYKIF